MEVKLYQAKLLPAEVDLTCQVGQSGEYVGMVNDSEAVFYKLYQRWKFYHPLSPDFKGTPDDLKLLTCPGDGYVPERPWCTFPRAYNYEQDIYLDLSPHTIFEDQ